MEPSQTADKSVPSKVIEDFLLSLENVEEFDANMIADLKMLAESNRIHMEKQVEDIINPDK